jgi:hypothetical protein
MLWRQCLERALLVQTAVGIAPPAATSGRSPAACCLPRGPWEAGRRHKLLIKAWAGSDGRGRTKCLCNESRNEGVGAGGERERERDNGVWTQKDFGGDLGKKVAVHQGTTGRHGRNMFAYPGGKRFSSAYAPCNSSGLLWENVAEGLKQGHLLVQGVYHTKVEVRWKRCQESSGKEENSPLQTCPEPSRENYGKSGRKSSMCGIVAGRSR